MSGGWEGSDRADRLPDDWPELRRLVFARCGNQCEWTLPSRTRCPRGATDVDHKRAGDDHRLSNLQGLCGFHHARKSAQEGNAGRWGPKKNRPAENHPGDRGVR